MNQPVPPSAWAPLPRLPATPLLEERADVVVIGSGAAGATAALGVARAGLRVLVITKSGLGAGSTTWAQGGLAAVLDVKHDSWQEHIDDTVTAGAGLSDRTVVEQLVRQAPEAVHNLIGLGAEFDRDLGGRLALAREGGHHRRRIVHAGGDATGAEVQRTLDGSLRAAGVAVDERSMAIDVVHDDCGRVAGVLVASVDEAGAVEVVTLVRTSALVVATGGLGQAYAVTTNPAQSTGDGLALAWRAGAAVADVEFVQFHPTAFWQAESRGQQLLVSEAVRGEGATLVDGAGRSVMKGVHPLGDLAPRDVVATAIAMRLRDAPGGIADHVYLDATSIGSDLVERFPTIVERCRAAGVDPVTEPIPVAPAAHFACGGVRASLNGVTSVPGLFAIGEVAATGVHGANRLASNGVTEGLVAGRLVAEVLVSELPRSGEPLLGQESIPVAAARSRSNMSRAMSRWVGALREAEGLTDASEQLTTHQLQSPGGLTSLAGLEATNLRTVSQLIVRSARQREESRGSHRRLDFPDRQDEWQVRIVHRWDGAKVSTELEAVGRE